MPRRHRCNRQGLRKAARVLEVGTTIAVAASASVASAFMVGAKNSISMPSHFVANGRGVQDLCSSCLLPVASVLKSQGPSHGRSHVDDESANARDLAHALLHHPGRKCGSGPLHATSILLHDEPVQFGGRQPVMSVMARWLIARCILSRARASVGLKVEVEASSNREAVKGRFDAVTIESDELMFDNIQVSGGAKFEVLGLDLLAAGLLPGPMRRLRKLRRPCEVSCVAEFTDTDLMYSPAFRRLAECIVNTALRPKGEQRNESSQGNSALGYLADEQRVHVCRVRLRGSKLVVEGEMESGPLFRVPFRYDISMSVSSDGQILYLREPTVYWGTPGGQVPIPMLPLQIFTVDLGNRARIEHLKIAKGRLEINGRFILSPISPLMVSRVTKRASFEHDLAESLSRIVCKTLRLRRE